MHKATILTVDDDDDLQFVMRQYLEPQGYKILAAANGKEFMDKFAQQPDIILLDLGLPDQDGLSLLSIIRNRSNSPVIVVSGRKETSDRIVGLELGADDYLIKPFEMHELAARIKAVLRRCKDSPKIVKEPEGTPLAKPKNLSFNGWVLDRMQYQIFDKDRKTPGLTCGEFKLLEALLESPNHVLTREKLFELTRQGKFDIYDRVIDTQVARIRKKIGDDPQTPLLIKTIRGVGYMFCGHVTSCE
jgi:two-component system OmpR family response regulator